MPMPVIQTSTGSLVGFGSLMRDDLLWNADALCRGVHVNTQVRMRERDVTERQRRVAARPAVDADFGFGDRKTGAFVQDAGLDGQQFARRHETAHLGFL